MTREELLLSACDTFSEAEKLMKAKNEDYSAEANDALQGIRFSATACGITQEQAMLYEIHKKLNRTKNLLDRPPSVKGEPVDKELTDIINYCAILRAIVQETQMKQTQARKEAT